MKLVFSLGTAIAVLAIGGAGCGGEPEGDSPTIKTPEEAASHIEKAFQDAEPQKQQQVKAAAQALEQKNYEDAVTSLNQLREQGELTRDQHITLQLSERALQRELAERAAQGDPAAKRAIQQYRNRHR